MSARRHEDVHCYLAMSLFEIAGSVTFKTGGICHVRWIVLFYCCSGFCTLSTTGTDVQGIMPTSVITMETKWGGVTSYTRFSKWRELTSRQSDRTSGLSLVSGTKSSGSPREKIVKARILKQISHLDRAARIWRHYSTCLSIDRFHVTSSLSKIQN